LAPIIGQSIIGAPLVLCRAASKTSLTHSLTHRLVVFIGCRWRPRISTWL